MNALLLKKGLEQQMWPDSQYVLYQVPKIGEKLTHALADVFYLQIIVFYIE